jgi:DNA-directed RNA polymerase specialized sigma24 family protein
VVALRDGRRFLRRDRSDVNVPPDRPFEGPEPGVVRSVWLGEAIDRLPVRQRAAVVLRHLGGLQLSEVADALGVTVGTVKASLHAAYRSLRVELTEDVLSEEAEPNAS